MIPLLVGSHFLVKGTTLSTLSDALIFRPAMLRLSRLLGTALQLRQSRRQLGQLPRTCCATSG